MLRDAALAGEHAVIFGPIGVGKSALLSAVGRDLRARGTRVGLAPRLEGLADVTAALARAHPDVEVGAVSARIARSRLRNANENCSCVLLLDGVEGAGTMTKGILRSLRGSGTGVLLAVDVNDPRDRAAMRGRHLARREIEIPPLRANTIRTILHAAVKDRLLAGVLGAEDLSGLAHACDGLPGRAKFFAAQLAKPTYWNAGRVRVHALRSLAIIEELEQYRARLGGVAHA
jgi:hypothetical protein